MKWTIDSIDTLKDKLIVVTGGNSGLGFEAIKWFVYKEAEVVMASRSIERGEKAKKEILLDSPNANITVMQLDLASKDSIHSFVKAFTEKYKKLDILLNNAGIMTTPYGLTEDGLEQQQGVNHFGHFLLTALLFDTIKRTKSSRIVNVSSIAHRGGSMKFKNLFYENGKRYSKIGAYGRSKLENLLFTYELNRKIKEKGLDVKVLVAHPGVSKTNLGRHISKPNTDKVIGGFQKLFSHHAKYGTLPEVRACVDTDAKSGEFYGPKGFMGMKGVPGIAKSNRKSHNLKDAKKLWELSEEVMGIEFKV